MTATLVAQIHVAADAEEAAAGAETATPLTGPAGIHLMPCGALVTFTTVLGPVVPRITRQGCLWASTTTAGVELLVVPKAYTTHRAAVVEGTHVVVTGRVDHRNTGPVLLTVHTIHPIGDPA